MSRGQPAARVRSVISAIEAVVGLAAIGGGAALAAAPDGRLLLADTSVLAQTPFADFFVPGLLLAVVVGGGGLIGAALTHWRVSLWWFYAALYGSGLVVFEVAEYGLIGFQVLQIVIVALALAIVFLAVSAVPSRDGTEGTHTGF